MNTHSQSASTLCENVEVKAHADSWGKDSYVPRPVTIRRLHLGFIAPAIGAAMRGTEIK